MKRVIALALIVLVAFSGCSSANAPHNKSTQQIGVRVDDQILISTISPTENETVSLISDFARQFLENYYFGKGPDAVASQEILAYGKKTLHQNVTVSWNCEAECNGYTLAYSTSRDFSNAILVETEDTSVTLPCLFAAQTYYWQVITHLGDEDNYSPVFSFNTAQTPRVLIIDGVSNARDIGGYLTEDGAYRVRQGMIYRGAELDEITGTGMEQATQNYGIKTDLDLRSPHSESDDMLYTDKSPILSGVNYLNIPGVSYTSALTAASTMYNVLEVFTHEENYPIYIHCKVGRDRTGTLVFIIGALLGVPEEKLLADFELTYLTNQGYAAGDMRGHTWMTDFLYQFHKIPGQTLKEKAENYCEAIGISRSQIEMIRNLMLEGV